MKQLLTINDNGDMLNIDMIAAITPTRNGCTILTKDGREFHSVFNLAKELEDDAEIRAVVPCHGVAALYYLGDNQTEIWCGDHSVPHPPRSHWGSVTGRNTLCQIGKRK